MRSCRFVAGCVLLGILMGVCALASAAELGVGTRAIGMGGSFTAIADDTSAPYWNPAGLAKAKRFSLQPPNIQARINANLDWEDVFRNPPVDDEERVELLKELGSGEASVDISANFAAVSPGLAVFFQPVGEAVVDASGVTFTGDYPTLESEATIRGSVFFYTGVSIARPLKDGASLGLTVKSVQIKSYSETIQYTDASGGSATIAETEEDKSGLGIDIGYLRDVSPKTSFGIVLRNMVRPSLGSLSPERQVNMGVAHRLNKNTLFAADINSLFDHPNLNLGAEVRAGKYMSLWAGVYERKPTLGVGLKILGANVQFAYSPENRSLGSGSLSF